MGTSCQAGRAASLLWRHEYSNGGGDYMPRHLSVAERAATPPANLYAVFRLTIAFFGTGLRFPLFLACAFFLGGFTPKVFRKPCTAFETLPFPFDSVTPGITQDGTRIPFV